MAFRDIRKSRKWLSANEMGILVGLAVLLIALLVLNIRAARTLPGGEWLYQRWSAARAFMGLRTPAATDQPYGTAIATGVQQIVYGRVAFPNEYRYVLSDPFYIVLFYIPFALFPDFNLARAIWMLLAEAAILFTVLLSLRLAEWEPPRGLFVILVVTAFVSFFSLNALLTASPTILLTLLYVSILLALRSFSDELAGGLLLLTAYQWEVGALFVLFVLIFTIVNGRWGVLAGFGMSLLVLLLVSFLAYPGWGLPYIRAVFSNLLQGWRLNMDFILMDWLPNVKFSLGAVMSVIAVGLVCIETVGALRAPFRRVMWVACLALAATPLLGLAMFPSNYITLLPSLILVVALVWERWLRRRILAVALILIVVLLVPFALYIQTIFVYAPTYTQVLSVLPPVATLLALYWMRWWVVHSPRTWADQIGYRK